MGLVLPGSADDDESKWRSTFSPARAAGWIRESAEAGPDEDNETLESKMVSKPLLIGDQRVTDMSNYCRQSA